MLTSGPQRSVSTEEDASCTSVLHGVELFDPNEPYACVKAAACNYWNASRAGVVALNALSTCGGLRERCSVRNGGVCGFYRYTATTPAESPHRQRTSRRDDAGERPASTVRPDSSAVADGSDLLRVCTPGGITMPSPVNTPHSVASSAPLRSGLQQRQAQSTDADCDATALVRAVVHSQGERLLRLRDVLSIVGLSRAHVYTTW